MATRKNTDSRSKKSENRNVQNKSKFEEMSVDDILDELTSGKANTTEEFTVKENSGKPVRKLAPVSSQAKPQVSGSSSANKKKKIVISAELPDYEALRQQEAEKQKAEEEQQVASASDIISQDSEPVPDEDVSYDDEYDSEEYDTDEYEDDEYEIEDSDEDTEEDEENEEEQEKPKKKGLFAKLKELLYKNVDDDDEDEDSDESDSSEQDDDDFSDSDFTVEPIEDNSEDIISDAIDAINDESITSDSTEFQDNEITAEDIISGTDSGASSMIENLSEDTDLQDVDDEYDSDDDEYEDDEYEDEEYEGDVNDIFDENPDDILEIRDNSTVEGAVQAVPKKKRNVYAVVGVVFAVLALCGLIAILVKGVSQVKSFTSGDTKKEAFTKVIYPAVIMDIQPFGSPAELTSEQIITASLWSIIMDEKKISKYNDNMGAVSVPATDVEVEAKQIFGDSVPPVTHCTVGPADAKFYYDADTNSYTVQANTTVYTYSPDVKSATKNNNDYSVIVDYVEERPTWMEKSSSKTVEYKLTEREDGSYFMTGMRIISVNTSND